MRESDKRVQTVASLYKAIVQDKTGVTAAFDSIVDENPRMGRVALLAIIDITISYFASSPDDVISCLRVYNQSLTQWSRCDRVRKRAIIQPMAQIVSRSYERGRKGAPNLFAYAQWDVYRGVHKAEPFSRIWYSDNKRPDPSDKRYNEQRVNRFMGFFFTAWDFLLRDVAILSKNDRNILCPTERQLPTQKAKGTPQRHHVAYSDGTDREKIAFRQKALNTVHNLLYRTISQSATPDAAQRVQIAIHAINFYIMLFYGPCTQNYIPGHNKDAAPIPTNEHEYQQIIVAFGSGIAPLDSDGSYPMEGLEQSADAPCRVSQQHLATFSKQAGIQYIKEFRKFAETIDARSASPLKASYHLMLDNEPVPEPIAVYRPALSQPHLFTMVPPAHIGLPGIPPPPPPSSSYGTIMPPPLPSF